MVEATHLQNYTLGEKIRENDICIIYAGKELKTDRPVTTSVINTKITKPGDFLSRFTQIAQKISRIESPHLVKILDSGEVGGQAVIVSEEVEGRILSDLTGKGDSLPLELVLGIARQLGEYLDALHRHGLYQVVFEPASITLTNDNIIRVLDLGLAQGLDVGALLAGGQLKPSACHAPELLRGEKADSRTDFYSLGVLLFSALTGKEPQVQVAEGKTPILRQTQDIALADFHPSQVRPGLAPELDELIARCLHPNPSRRIQSAAEFLNKVEEVRRGMEVGGKDTILGMEGSLVGQTLGAYRLVERLGQGGMATVYKAYEAGLDRYVAIKVLPQFFASDPSFTQRFRREAKAVAQLNHPNIVPIYNFGEEGGITYIAMQLMQGGTLKRERGQVFGCEEALRLLLPITRALGYAHVRGIVHRDIKPSNVLMTEGNWPVLADFGLAQIVEASIRLTGTGVGMGTPAYMSPEQGQGAKVDHRTDIYSLGVMLYEMVTGDIPFKADTPMAIVIKHLTAPMPLPRQVNPEIPEDVEKIILKATAKNPDERFQTAEELAMVMERLLEEIVFARKSKIVVQGKKPQKISPTPAPISKVGPAETGYPQASRQRQDKTTADNLPFTRTGAQSGIRRGGRRIWVMGGLLATLILGIGGGLFWLGKNGLFAAPAPTSTATRTAPTLTPTPALDPELQAALDTIQNEEPLYQTNFDDWDSDDTGQNAAIVNGKLILTSEDENGSHLELNAYPSDSYAVEFELSISGDSSSDGDCVYETGNGAPYGDESNRAFSAEFHPGEDLAVLSSYVHQLRGHERIVTASFDKTKSNVVALVVLGDRITAFINGELAYTAQDPAGSAVYLYNGLSAYNQVTCEFDHFKYWDLREMDSAVKIALAAIQNEEPLYQTSFDTWEFGNLVENARVENGKLIVTSPGEHVGVDADTPDSDRFAVQFDVRMSEASPEGHCIFYSNNVGSGESFRSIATGFFSSGNTNLALSVLENTQEDLAANTFDASKTNTVMLIVLGDQIAKFVNGQILNTAFNPDVDAVYAYTTFAASHAITCEYDNYKFWDLSGADFSAASKVVIPIGRMDASIPWLPLDTSARPSTVWIGFNTDEPPFNNYLVRKAFAAALDREALAGIAEEHGAQNVKPATGFIPPETLGRDLYGMVGIPFNRVLARMYLAQAGYPDGAGFPKVTLYSNSTDLYVPLFNAVVQMWEENLNVKVELIFIETADEYWGMIINPSRPPVYRLGWQADINDPSNFTLVFRTGFEWNFTGISNSKLDQLIEEAEQTADPAKRQELYIAIERLVCEEETWIIPIIHSTISE